MKFYDRKKEADVLCQNWERSVKAHRVPSKGICHLITCKIKKMKEKAYDFREVCK